MLCPCEAACHVGVLPPGKRGDCIDRRSGVDRAGYVACYGRRRPPTVSGFSWSASMYENPVVQAPSNGHGAAATGECRAGEGASPRRQGGRDRRDSRRDPRRPDLGPQSVLGAAGPDQKAEPYRGGRLGLGHRVRRGRADHRADPADGNDASAFAGPRSRRCRTAAQGSAPSGAACRSAIEGFRVRLAAASGRCDA